MQGNLIFQSPPVFFALPVLMEWYTWVFSGIGVSILLLMVQTDRSGALKSSLNTIVLKRHNYLLSKGIGFCLNLYAVEFKLLEDGSSESMAKIEIESVNKEIVSRDHRYYTTGDSHFINTNIEVSGESKHTSVSHSIVSQDDNLINIEIRFSPALRKKQKAMYTIKRKSAP